MLRLKTQTSEFWLEKFQVTSEDAEYLRDLLLDAGRPLPTRDLAAALMAWRCHQEEEAIRAELARGTVYQPRNRYQVGQQIMFPALDFATGTVKGVREGFNPEYGPFEVIQVELPGQETLREFAAGLQAPHKLNWGDETGLLLPALRPASDLFTEFGSRVQERLEAWLEREGSGFVRLGDRWIARSMLADIHLGHLNIAEAFIEVQGHPVKTAEILPELDLPAGIPREIQILSLEYALETDNRFVDVGAEGARRWSLRRLMPKSAVEPPAWFLAEVPSCDRSVLPGELLALELEIDDENGLAELLGAVDLGSPDKVTLTLNYPHWRIGTLPLTKKTRPLFPRGTKQRTRIRFVDAQTGSEWEGWVVHEHRYVYGLKEWYAQKQIPVGGLVTLERTANPFVLVLGYQPRRMKRQWVRTAKVEGDRLTFAMLKQPIYCELDDLMCIWTDEPEAVDALWALHQERRTPLAEIVREVFMELAGLSPEGTVHAKTLYSAVNLVRRCPPGPLFVELVTNSAFRSVAPGLWTLER
ncbi:MAG: hypothetical protein ACUVXH_03325 [Anaerolineae bacterium]